MKKHFGKKAAALALVLSLFVSLLSVAAAAAEPETEEAPASDISQEILAEENTSAEDSPVTVIQPEQEFNADADIPVESLPVTVSDLKQGFDTEGEEPTIPDVQMENIPAEEQAADEDSLTGEQPADESLPAEQTEQTVCENGTHTPDLTQAFPASYVDCNGGYQEVTYPCTTCGVRVNESKNTVQWQQGNGNHTRGSEKHAANYTPCLGGVKTEFYECTACRIPLNENGTLADFINGTGVHTPGDKHAADYTPCLGGFKTEYYECTACRAIVNAEGNTIFSISGTGVHTPGSEKYEPDYAPCEGGFQTEWYRCTACDRPVNANGGEATYVQGNGKHQLTAVPAAAPTYEQGGYPAYWSCSVCHVLFADSAGTVYVTSDFFLPPLTRDTEVTTESLTAVPVAVAGKYATVNAIQTALLDIAKAAGFQPDRTNTGSVLFDVTLQIKNADGTLTPVSLENFPAEGVTVVLPFPAGTNRNYTFVITHMIAHGDRAGQIEVLPSVNSESGICVHFSSMSPVCISYMLESGAPVPETSAPAPAAPVISSTVPKTGDPAHGAPWGMLALLSIGGVGALFIAGKKLHGF